MMKLNRRPCLCLFTVGLLMGLGVSTARADNLLPNGNLVAGKSGWSLFVPSESKGATCTLTVSTAGGHDEAACAQMKSEDFARYSFGPYISIACKPGDRFRVTYWLKNAGAVVQPGTVGVVGRLLLMHGDKTVPDGTAIYIRCDGKTAVQSTESLPNPGLATSNLPKDWSKVEAVFEIPSTGGVDHISGPSIFGWSTRGAFLIGDMSMEQVAPQTPITGSITDLTSTTTHASGPIASESDALAALNLDAPGMEAVKSAAEQHDIAAVKAAYLEYRKHKSPAKFLERPVGDPHVQSINTDVVGDEILRNHIRNTYGFAPIAGDMGTPFDWKANPIARNLPNFTYEWTYCIISRQGFLKQLADAYWKTGNEQYARKWVDLFTEFLQKNPSDAVAVNGDPSLWRTLDGSERMYDAWPYSLPRIQRSQAFTSDVQWLYLRGLLDHVQMLKAGLEVPGRTGNWVISECYGLYAIGATFPELRQAPEWRDYAMARMVKELNICVPPDGFEAELTPNYHFFTLSCFVGPMQLALANHLSVPAEFSDKLRSMYRAAVLVMDQRGFNVCTNDSGLQSASQHARQGLELFPEDPLLQWAASKAKHGVPPAASTELPYAGFYAMRGGWKPDDTFIFFRAGPTGFAHEHEDMLEIVLRAFNRSLLFEQGTYEYDQSDWRRFVLGTSSHSTIIVDGNGQHRGRSSPPVLRSTNPWVSTPAFDFVAGTYDQGYQQSVHDMKRIGSGVSYVGPVDKSVSHTRRVLFLKPYYALVLDTLDGTGTHTFDSLYYLDSPAAAVDAQTQAVVSKNTGDVQLSIYPLDKENLSVDIVHGQKDPILGWFANENRTVPTARFRKQQAAPARFATFLYPYEGKQPTFHGETVPQAQGVWGQHITTSMEDATVAISLDDTPRSLVCGNSHATGAGMLIRKPETGDPFSSGWKLSDFADSAVAFTATEPATIVWQQRGDSLLCFNAGESDCHLSVAKPFIDAVTLPAHSWVWAGKTGTNSVDAPTLLPPMKADFEGMPYLEYLKQHPDARAGKPQPLRLLANQLVLPEKAVLGDSIGADHPVLVNWRNASTHVVAKFDVPESGLYILKLRCCTAEIPVRSVRINGKVPFAEANHASFPNTVGEIPSNGYSAKTNDWRDVTLGEDIISGGWKFYFAKGPNELEIQCESGSMNLASIEIIGQ